MLPIRDENPTVHRSLMTFVIIIANVVVWAFVQGLGREAALIDSICRFGLIPAAVLGKIPPGTMIQLGERVVCDVGSTAGWASVVTSMFLHGGWMHIIGNMWFLAIFGDNVEEAMGSVRFTIFYIVCGLAAASAQMYSGPDSVIPMVGASGAIGGIMGAYALLYPMARVHMLVFLGFFITTIRIPAFLMLGYWFGLQLLSGFAGSTAGVAVWAHAGGFAAGLILARLFCNSERLAECRERRKAYSQTQGG
ncbi:rhomboid family intramembrane serine protease [Planctomycetota bacterium]